MIIDLDAVDAFAAAAHQGQTRNTGDPTAPEVPYIVHPRAVRDILAHEHPDEAARAPWILAVALLHDVLEDCDVDPSVMAARFGVDVALAVGMLSKEFKAVPSALKSADDYWSDLAGASLAVRQVKAADRIDNLRSCLRWHRTKIARKYLVETPRLMLPMIVDDAFLYATIAELLARVRLAYPEAGAHG